MPVNKKPPIKLLVILAMTIFACVNFGYAWGWHVGAGIFFILPYITRCVNKLSGVR